MSRDLPKKTRRTPPQLRWLLGASLLFHGAAISNIPLRSAMVASPPEKPKTVLHFQLKPPPPPGASPGPQMPPPDPKKAMQKPPEQKEAAKPPSDKKDEKPTPQPSLKPPLQKVRLGGAQDHESNNQDKGSLPSAQKAEKFEMGGGLRPKEEGEEMAVPKGTEKPETKEEPKPSAAPPSPASPPPPSPASTPPPSPAAPPSPKAAKPEDKLEKAAKPDEDEDEEDDEKPEKKPEKKLEKPPQKEREMLAKREELLRSMQRPTPKPSPKKPEKKPAPKKPSRKKPQTAEELLEKIREKRPDFLADDMPRPRPMQDSPAGVQTSRFIPQGPKNRGRNADPLAGTQGFIPLSQALSKLSQGGPVPKIMPDAVNSNMASDGSIGLDEFRQMLLQHLRHYKVWPDGYADLGLQGKVYVSCRIDGFTGELIDFRIWRGSGHPEIDQAAIASLKRASPYPPIGTPGTLYLDLVLQYDDRDAEGI